MGILREIRRSSNDDNDPWKNLGQLSSFAFNAALVACAKVGFFYNCKHQAVGGGQEPSFTTCARSFGHGDIDGEAIITIPVFC